MQVTTKSLRLAVLATMALASEIAIAQATIDLENRYPSMGAIMVWRVDSAGNPVELRGFASGILIGERVMVGIGLVGTLMVLRWVWSTLGDTPGPAPHALTAAVVASVAVIAATAFFAVRDLFDLKS